MNNFHFIDDDGDVVDDDGNDNGTRVSDIVAIDI